MNMISPDLHRLDQQWLLIHRRINNYADQEMVLKDNPSLNQNLPMQY